MTLLFLIPARGGSKGFPGKNLALLGGLSLVARATRTATTVASEYPGSRVICSTDDASIAAEARAWGAETPFERPRNLATDEASSTSVAQHALAAIGGGFDAVVLLQPTSPLVEPKDIRAALSCFAESRAPVVSVCVSEHPVEWFHYLDADGRLRPVSPGEWVERRQASVPAYRPNGAVYVATPDQVRTGFWTPDTRGSVMPIERSVDIDTRRDLTLAAAWLAEQPTSRLTIAERHVGAGYPCFVIAEAGVNHNGQLNLALKLVDAAADAGADAVKFQTFRAAELATPLAPKAEYQERATGASESQLEMLKRLELSPSDHRTIGDHCRRRGVMFLSSPFDLQGGALLKSLGVPALKVSSGELTNLSLLRGLAALELPLIVSTGMATLRDVHAAVEAVALAGGAGLALLQCVSTYPADPRDTNLRAMATMAAAFGVPIGYSDHTVGVEVPLAAVALGACIIEKHLTLDRALPGPDHRASTEPAEFAALVSAIRHVEQAMGDGVKQPRPAERNTAQVARRSLVAATTIAPGARLTEDMVSSRRPGTGLAPSRLAELLGRTARQEIAEGTLLSIEMFV
jgi:N,N'-diacetyllegionaminate synthase